MSTVNRIKVPCQSLEGLNFNSISNVDNSFDLSLSIKPIQFKLDSFDYDRTLSNDHNFALKYNSLENPKTSASLKVTMYRFKPYKTYSNKIKILKNYNNKTKG